ncbi:MAG TPA: glycosyltransferase [Burkholderiales bacterium]
MRFIKRSARAKPRLSLILLDWSVRESFHLLHYLARQDVPRDAFEVLVVEYYSRVSEAVRTFEEQVDTWLLLEMPEDCYYHKHLMYNAGIVLARGDICVVCDSDAMVKPGFVRAIVEQFEQDPRVVLHLDQFRNNRRDLYPFSFPSFEAVEGEGCVNNAGGRTAGILDPRDPIHSRNYGACMCASRTDLIAIGGADEHVDFVGHICGPYDMTFRLVNHGLREVWHASEFMYHTWHPGQAGLDNYLGPHDGHHLSTTALAALASRRVAPLLESPAIRALREGAAVPAERLLDRLIRPEGPAEWLRDKLERGAAARHTDEGDMHVGFHRGYSIYRRGRAYAAHLSIVEPGPFSASDRGWLEAASLEGIRRRIDAENPAGTGIAALFARLFVVGPLALDALLRRAQRGLLTQGSAGAASPRRPLPELARRLRYRLGQFAVRWREFADALFHLVPNLWHARRCARGNIEAADLRILVDNPIAESYLRFLRMVGAIPLVKLERVDERGAFCRILDDALREGPGGRLLVNRGLYFRYHADAVPLRDRLGLVVL